MFARNFWHLEPNKEIDKTANVQKRKYFYFECNVMKYFDWCIFDFMKSKFTALASSGLRSMMKMFENANCVTCKWCTVYGKRRNKRSEKEVEDELFKSLSNVRSAYNPKTLLRRNAISPTLQLNQLHWMPFQCMHIYILPTKKQILSSNFSAIVVTQCIPIELDNLFDITEFHCYLQQRSVSVVLDSSNKILFWNRFICAKLRFVYC